MAAGDKIDKDDYNRVQELASAMLGTGSGSFGYGQSVASGAVTGNNKVGRTEWQNLQYDLVSITRHQNGTIPDLLALPLPTKDTKIVFNSVTAPVNSFELYVAGIVSSRFTISAVQLSDTFWGTKNYTGLWNNSLTFFIDVNFNSSNSARHFFNMGGKIRITASRSGGTEVGGSTTIRLQNESWTQLLDTAEALFGGAPTTLADDLDGSNFYRCSSSYTDHFYRITDDSPYQLNYFQVSASTPSDNDNRDGGSSNLQLKVEFIDGHKQINRFAVADGTDGTFSVTVETLDPNGRSYPSNQPFTIYGPSSITIGDGIATSIVNYP